MNVSAEDEQRFQFTTASDALGKSIMATETPLLANEYPSIYHNSPVTLRTSEEATAVNGNHDISLVSANDIVPVATQLKLVHDGIEFFLVREYPIQLLSEDAAAEDGNGDLDSGGDTLEIVSTVCSEGHEPFMNIPARGNNVSQQLSTIETLTATSHDGTVSKVMNPQNHPKYRPKTDVTLKRISNTVDRNIQIMKRQADINFLLQSTAPKHKITAMQKHNILNIHPQFKCNHSQGNIKPLQFSFLCNGQATLYKVVCPGKIDGRLLLNNICGIDSRVQRKSAKAEMPQPMLKQAVKRALYVPLQKTRCLSSKRRSRSDNVLNKTGVQTRSGRLSKPPQALTDEFVCRVTKDVYNQQQPSSEVNTFNEVRSCMEENKENPEQHVAKLAPTTARRKAKVQPQYQCGTCHKIYLGRRMARHLHAYPTHVTLEKLDSSKTKTDAMDSTRGAPALPSLKPALHDPSSPPTQLYRLLVDIVTAPKTESNQRAVLLGEISQFVGLVRSRVPSLIVPSEREDNETVYVDQNVADVLQLNPGNYRIRMDAFVQEREKFLHNGASGSDKSGLAHPVNDAAEQEKDPDSANVSSELDCELTAVSSFESLLQDFAELEHQEQQGLLMHLPLPIDLNDNEDLKANLETEVPVLVPAAATTAFSEPVVMSNQGTTAFGRLCRLSEDLFPSQSQEVLQAFEELTNLSELCSPQVLGVSGGAAANESSSALAFE